ncbi:DNA-3-methyladenine glycosylase [Edaphobacter sp. 12200R-103]|uniref:DNA-3-methyladenine glycosylase n=1 Tax=Edaphobacter sp. 12200R-103 TaxID=2703788 RepID=UPI001EE4B2DA|nr:DNA-3-methyladenine glycosylase [Edaphobacter sp. 12200R-103]
MATDSPATEMSLLPSQFPVLSSDFFLRSPDIVARDILGKVLVHRRRGERLSGRIVEVEAYLGLNDPASHAFRGRTSANAVLFGPPGIAYVYFIYGMHYCVNVSCLPENEPGGVLIRALVPLEGIKTMARLRGLPENAKAQQLTGGPGKLCEAIGITRATHNGIDVTKAESSLHIEDDGVGLGKIEITPRIGITKAIEHPLRFVLKDWK